MFHKNNLPSFPLRPSCHSSAYCSNGLKTSVYADLQIFAFIPLPFLPLTSQQQT